MEFDVDGQVSSFVLHNYSKAIETGITSGLNLINCVDIRKKNFYWLKTIVLNQVAIQIR